MAIKIITDSTSDITQSQAKEMDITVLPLKVIFDGKEYRDGIDLTNQQFYQKLAQSESLPTTSALGANDFLPHFERVQEAGDTAIVLLLCGKLSGTLQSAHIAKQQVGYPNIHIVDSYNTILGLRLLVDRAVALRDAGAEAEEILAEMERLIPKIMLFAMVDTLEYLHKGGRLSKSSKIMGTLLKMKPLVGLVEGEVKVLGKARGNERALNHLIELIEGTKGIDLTYPVYFGYTGEEHACDSLMERVQQEYSVSQAVLSSVGSVVGTHAGPGACTVAFVQKES